MQKYRGYILLGLCSLLVGLAFLLYAGTPDKNGVGTDYMLDVAGFRVGIYSQPKIMSFVIGSRAIGTTFGVANYLPFGSFHTATHCYGSCDE